MNKLQKYYDLVEQKYLNKQESGDLILFNYTDKCTYEKFWTPETREARGIIFNKVTGECVARPLPKFFNIGEMEETRLENLPNQEYNVYEKLDGSLGILYYHPNQGNWKIATRGSFTSPQAIKATEMFYKNASHQLSDLYLNNYTLLFEIIYPENRVNPGARLVVDYGSSETLVLLAAIEKNTQVDLSYNLLLEIGKQLNFPVAKKYDYTIEQMIELQKTLPKTQEGFVVKFASGLRVKIKGQEYCRYQRILNSITPIFMWELMSENVDFSLKTEYKASIPEEILPEVEEIEAKLKERWLQVYRQTLNDYWRYLHTHNDISLRTLGMFSQDPANNVRHSPAMFFHHKQEFNRLDKYIVKQIRPTGNML